MYASSATDAGQGGVQTWVRLGLEDHAGISNPAGHRLMSICTTINRKRCLVVNAHAPIEAA
eukprot:6649776-Karenia_brevis.AAC.1